MRKPSRTSALRFAFAFSLLAAAAVCCTVSYLLISNLERVVFEENYNAIATTGLARAQELTLRRIKGLATTATMMAFRYPDAEKDWPLVALNGYSEVAEKVADLSGARAMGLMPFVTPDQAEEFEQHAKQIYLNNTFQNYPNGTGESDFGFGIWKRSKDSPYSDKRMHDTTGETPFPSKYQGLLAPILEHNWKASPAIMFNIHSEKFRAAGLDSTLDCIYKSVNKQQEEGGARTTKTPECTAVSDWMELVPFPGEPAGQIYLPIFPANDPMTVVGMVGSTLLWDLDVLQQVFPSNVYGLHCVIATATNQFTYIINDGKPERLGKGDLHDQTFDSYNQTITLTDFTTGATESADYTLTVYPTSIMFEKYTTRTPLAVAFGFFGVILFCAILFLIYDILIRHESHQRKVVLEMKRAFVRFISHEIRTPLNTVCLGLELLENELNDQKKRLLLAGAEKKEEKNSTSGVEETSHDIEQTRTNIKEDTSSIHQEIDVCLDVTHDIHENAQSAVSVLNDLLNYDKIESHTLHIETTPVEIWNLIQRVVKSFQIQAANKEVNLDFDVLTTTSSSVSSSDDDIESNYNHSVNHNADYLRVIGDDIRLTQVLRNVISNALKFTDTGGNVQVTAQYVPNGLPNAKPVQLTNYSSLSSSGNSNNNNKELFLKPRSGSIRISIKDSGEGLSKDQLEDLFKEGVQFNVNKLQHGGGSGLGLSIAKGIVEKHSGTITATSEGLGFGTTFLVELPLYGSPPGHTSVMMEHHPHNNMEHNTTTSTTASSQMTESLTKQDSTRNSTISTKEASAAHEEDYRKRRILVVEDTSSSRKMLVRLLERAGHSCVTAVNGKESVDIIAKEKEEYEKALQVVDLENTTSSNATPFTPIDTILMDYEMPIMNGPEATSEIRKIGYHDMIIGVTGNVLSEDVEFFLRVGADDVLSKPISMAALNQKWEQEPAWSISY